MCCHTWVLINTEYIIDFIYRFRWFIARYFSEILLLIRESREFTTIANIAIRFKLEEMDPEGKARDMIKGGLLSGLPVDERFFYVFCECIVFGSVAVFIPYR